MMQQMAQADKAAISVIPVANAFTAVPVISKTFQEIGDVVFRIRGIEGTLLRPKSVMSIVITFW